MAHPQITLVALLFASSSVISGAVEVDREDDSCTLLQKAKNAVTLSRDEVLGCRELVPLLDGHDEILEHFCAVGLPAGTCSNALNALGPRPWSADTVGKVCDVWESAMVSQRLTNEKLTSLLSRRMSKGTQLTQERLDSAVLRKGGGDASDGALHNNTAPPGKDLTCFSAADGLAMVAQNKKGKPACASTCHKTPTTCEMLKSVLEGCAKTCTPAEKRTLRFTIMFSFNNKLDCKCTEGLPAGPATNGTTNETAGNASATNTTHKGKANGTASNGTASNGTASNGTAANGTAANGTEANGTAANGTAANGKAANGTRANETAANSTAANGTAANGTGANGTAANGTGANGTAAKDDKAATATTAAPAADAAPTTAPAADDAAADAAPAADEAP